MLVTTPYECRNCGHIFMHTVGGFILKPSTPQCPKCGSINVKKTK